MGKAVILGGGEIGRPGHQVETTKIDRETIRLTGKKHPKLLFVPTASSDSEDYVEVVNKHFGKRLGCNVDSLMLLKNKYPRKELTDKILSSDIIYVGGGNTLKMMRKWRSTGADKLFARAYRQGTVISGLSAGGICWFDSGHSDSMKIYGKKDWEYINVKGLGLIKGIHCPHFDSHTGGKSRRSDFKEFMKKHSSMGIAIDEKCAIEFVNDTYRVISANNKSKAYRVFKKRGKIHLEKIKRTKGFKPLEELYQR